MKRFSILTIVCLAVFVACKQETAKTYEIEIGDSEDVDIYAKDYWEHAQIIPLMENQETVLGDASMIRCNSKYYVLSNEMGRISVFDLEGNSVASSNRQGNAHNEYLAILDLDVTEDSIYILCSPKSKIIVTDMACQVSRVIDTDRDFTSLACYDGNLYGYTQDNRSLYVCEDDIWKLVASEGKLPSCPHHSNSCFFKTDGKLFYFPEGGDKMYEVNDDEATPLFTVNYPDKDKIEGRMKQNKMYDSEERMNLTPPRVMSFVSTNDSYIMTYSFRMLIDVCVINKKDNSLQKDGSWSFSLHPDIAYTDGCLATSFISRYSMPIDTNQIKVSYTREPDWENGQLAIIKYLNDGN